VRPFCSEETNSWPIAMATTVLSKNNLDPIPPVNKIILEMPPEEFAAVMQAWTAFNPPRSTVADGSSPSLNRREKRLGAGQSPTQEETLRYGMGQMCFGADGKVSTQFECGPVAVEASTRGVKASISGGPFEFAVKLENP
jgi:hypothetical protein